MAVALRIKDETSSGEVIWEGVFKFPAERVTAQEPIEARVSQEVEAYNAFDTGRFMGLIQPRLAEKDLNGYKLKRGKLVEVEEQKKIAIQAFQTNGFFLLVNDQQVTELGDIITLTPKTAVVFLKLIPLVGG